MTCTRYAEASTPESFVTSISGDGTITVVALCGEADTFTLPLVVAALGGAIASRHGAIVVDLADTEFIDVRNVRAIGDAWRLLNERDGR